MSADADVLARLTAASGSEPGTQRTGSRLHHEERPGLSRNGPPRVAVPLRPRQRQRERAPLPGRALHHVVRPRVLIPVKSGISKRFCRYISQEVCPWNQRFAQSLAADSPFQPRAAIAGRDARTLARELLAMTQEEFSAAFKGSPMKRAKLRGLKRNAAVVLANIGNPDDAPVLAAAIGDPVTRAHD